MGNVLTGAAKIKVESSSSYCGQVSRSIHYSITKCMASINIIFSFHSHAYTCDLELATILNTGLRTYRPINPMAPRAMEDFTTD